jgi:SAM-dependent methyltransferase
VYSTRHFPKQLATTSGSGFVRRSFAYYVPRALRRRLGRLSRGSVIRDAGTVRTVYDTERGHMLARIGKLTFDELVFGTADKFDETPDTDFTLQRDRVVWGSSSESRRMIAERLADEIANLTEPGSLVVEMGSGSGRNLLFLKRRLPDREFLGYELSPVSVELARRSSERFALAVRFETADATKPLPRIGDGRVDVVFSSHALEMMPRIFVGAVRNMFDLQPAHLLFFEPVPELWPRNLRGMASRARTITLDRLRNFMPALRSELARRGGWQLVRAERLRTAINPLNETCFVHLRRETPAA